MSLITCENLTLAYDTGVVASGVSFTLEAGSYLCIVGENGSGKSTLLKSMASGIFPSILPPRGIFPPRYGRSCGRDA